MPGSPGASGARFGRATGARRGPARRPAGAAAGALVWVGDHVTSFLFCFGLLEGRDETEGGVRLERVPPLVWITPSQQGGDPPSRPSSKFLQTRGPLHQRTMLPFGAIAAFRSNCSPKMGESPRARAPHGRSSRTPPTGSNCPLLPGQSTSGPSLTTALLKLSHPTTGCLRARPRLHTEPGGLRLRHEQKGGGCMSPARENGLLLPWVQWISSFLGRTATAGRVACPPIKSRRLTPRRGGTERGQSIADAAPRSRVRAVYFCPWRTGEAAKHGTIEPVRCGGAGASTWRWGCGVVRGVVRQLTWSW